MFVSDGRVVTYRTGNKDVSTGVIHKDLKDANGNAVDLETRWSKKIPMPE